MKVFVSIIAGAGVLAALFYVFVLGGGVPQPRLIRLDPPDGFVAEDYQDFATLSDQNGVSVVPLATFGKWPFTQYLQDLDMVYVSATDEAADSSVGVFFNRDAAVIGKIETPRRPVQMGTTFITFDGYYEVSADQVSALTPYTLLDAPVSEAKLRELHQESTLFWRMSNSDVTPDRPEYASKQVTHVMRHKGEWKKVFSAYEGFLDFKTAGFPEFQVQYRHAPDARAADLRSFHDGKYVFRRTHFDRQEYFKRKAASWGSTTGVGRPEHYRGTGYYTLQAGDRALRFFIRDDVSDGYQTMKVMGHDALDFVILQYNGRGNEAVPFLLSAPD